MTARQDAEAARAELRGLRAEAEAARAAGARLNSRLTEAGAAEGAARARAEAAEQALKQARETHAREQRYMLVRGVQGWLLASPACLLLPLPLPHETLTPSFHLLRPHPISPAPLACLSSSPSPYLFWS